MARDFMMIIIKSKKYNHYKYYDNSFVKVKISKSQEYSKCVARLAKLLLTFSLNSVKWPKKRINNGIIEFIRGHLHEKGNKYGG